MDIPRNWTFETEEIASGFDKHVNEQLPWYELVTGAIQHIARHYIADESQVYDIGASTGNIGRCLYEILNNRNANFTPIECSQEMINRYNGYGKPIMADATTYNYKQFDFATCFLVLMFMPVIQRESFLDMLYASLNPGGCIVIVDKCEALSGYAATVLWRLALAGKVAAGTEPKDVISKELSLSGIQRPLNTNLLKKYNAIEFFRFGDFAGWMLEK